MIPTLLLITHIFSPIVLIIASVCICIYACMDTKGFSFRSFFKPKDLSRFPPKFHSAMIILSSTALASVLTYVVKEIYKIPRPIATIIYETGYSFPSGHATVSAAFFAAIIYSIIRFSKRSYTPVLYILAVIPILVSSTRVLLHVHRTLDVVAGIILGIFSFCVVVLVYGWYISKHQKQHA